MQRAVIVVAALCLLVATGAQATPYAGEFLATGIGARPLGMGGAFVALADDASATYWNASALPRAKRGAIYMHSERFGQLVNYDSGALVFRSRESESGAKSAFGIGLVMVSIPGIIFTTTDPTELAQIETGLDGLYNTNDPDGTEGNGRIDGPTERLNFELLANTAKEVTDRQTGVFLSYGRTRVFHPSLSMGGSVKFVRKSVGSYSAWGIGVDLGAFYDVTPNWAVAANLQDITTTFLDWSNTPSGEREYITPNVKLGTAYTREIGAIAGSITVAGDFDFRFETETGASFKAGSVTGDVRAGVEYWYRDTLALRFGSERLGGDTNPFTGGAGLRIKAVTFDYAYLSHSDLDDVHRISGGVVF